MTVGATPVPIFQPTLPMRGATLPPSQQGQPRLISIPTSYAGGDAARSTSHRLRSYFNPHLLCGRRLVSRLDGAMGQNFNPRSPCGERRIINPTIGDFVDFNPRSPCGERHEARSPVDVRPTDISTHAPHAGSDCLAKTIETKTRYFNPRSPCGERPKQRMRSMWSSIFQPTLPMRGATRRIGSYGVGRSISTHAPHAGSDVTTGALSRIARDFNPRSPCGERLTRPPRTCAHGNFNPRSPCGERPWSLYRPRRIA